MSITCRETDKSMRAAEGLVDLLSMPEVGAALLAIFVIALVVLA